MRSSHRFASPLTLLLFAAAALPARADFPSLARLLPDGPNAVVAVDIERLLVSPLATSEGWQAQLEQNAALAPVAVPPRAQRMLVAAQLDLEFFKAAWEASVIEFNEAPSLLTIAARYVGQADLLAETPVVRLPSDTYVLQLGPQIIGAIAPAQRQNALRWAQAAASGRSSLLAPRLSDAIASLQTTGPQVVMAIDLLGAYAPDQVASLLGSTSDLGIDPTRIGALSAALSTVTGVRLTAEVTTAIAGQVQFEFLQPVTITPDEAKRVLLAVLAAGGMHVEDASAWQAEVGSHSLTFRGPMQREGLKRLMALVESPAPQETATPSAAASATTPMAPDVQLTRQYFQGIDATFKSLERDMRETTVSTQTALWFDKAARRIERLPMLGVDGQMLDYGVYVADKLRQAALEVRNRGIQASARSAQVRPGGSYDYGSYGNYGYGRSWTAPTTQGVERRAIRADERTAGAQTVQQIRDDVIAATNDIRREMTNRYQQQF